MTCSHGFFTFSEAGTNQIKSNRVSRVGSEGSASRSSGTANTNTKIFSTATAPTKIPQKISHPPPAVAKDRPAVYAPRAYYRTDEAQYLCRWKHAVFLARATEDLMRQDLKRRQPSPPLILHVQSHFCGKTERDIFLHINPWLLS